MAGQIGQQAVEGVGQQLLRHRHGILAFLYGFLRDFHACEDVFQELSLVAIRKADEFRPGTSFVAWVLAIARNKIREHLRERRGIVVDEDALEAMRRAFATAAFDADLERRKSALRKCLNTLAEHARRFVERRYLDGMSPGAMAIELQKSRESVNSILQRIRERLRACVERRLISAQNG